MGHTLGRYLLREVARTFGAAAALAVSVLFVLRIVEFVDLAFARGVPGGLVGRLAGYIVPSYLEMALPMAALLPGEYGLRVTVAAGSQTASRQATFVVAE